MQLSNNHTLNGRPFFDVCNELAGEYPKDFVFKGWHPLCRCIVTPIIPDWDEYMKKAEMEIDGKDVSDYHYEGEVTEMPDNFTTWVEKNQERISAAKVKPYFIEDNFVDGDTSKGYVWKQQKETVKEPVAIKAHKYGDKGKHVVKNEDDMLALYDKPENNKAISFTQDQLDNNAQISKLLNTEQQKPMPHYLANSGNVNPDIGFVGSKDNCALCSFTYELRRRGFNVKAKLLNPLDNTSDAWTAGEDYAELWKGVEVSSAEATKNKNIALALNDATKKEGRYHLAWDWNSQQGHNITAERLHDGSLVLYDAQKKFYYDITEYFNNVKKISVYKVDQAIVNTDNITLTDVVEKITFKKRGRK